MLKIFMFSKYSKRFSIISIKTYNKDLLDKKDTKY